MLSLNSQSFDPPSALFCSKPCLQKQWDQETPDLRFTDMPAYMPYLYKVIFNSRTQMLEHRNIDRGWGIMPLGRLNFGAWCLKMLKKKPTQTNLLLKTMKIGLMWYFFPFPPKFSVRVTRRAVLRLLDVAICRQWMVPTTAMHQWTTEPSDLFVFPRGYINLRHTHKEVISK